MGMAASTTEVEDDVDGGPLLVDAASGSGSVHHQVLKMTSMAGPLGALPVGPSAATEVEEDIHGGPRRALPTGPAASTNEDEEDVDGGPLGGRC